jgi:hypothetical protein
VCATHCPVLCQSMYARCGCQCLREDPFTCTPWWFAYAALSSAGEGLLWPIWLGLGYHNGMQATVVRCSHARQDMYNRLRGMCRCTRHTAVAWQIGFDSAGCFAAAFFVVEGCDVRRLVSCWLWKSLLLLLGIETRSHGHSRLKLVLMLCCCCKGCVGLWVLCRLVFGSDLCKGACCRGLPSAPQHPSTHFFAALLPLCC